MSDVTHAPPIPGVRIGHAQSDRLCSGVTAILFDQPAVASVAVLGGAPGGRDLGPLAAEATLAATDAIVLSGGSAYGLDAAGGVQSVLRERGRGVRLGQARVPLVPQAIIFDLAEVDTASWDRFPPYRDLGYAAAQSAEESGFTIEGSIGAGLGATTATVRGGLGIAFAHAPPGFRIAAVAVVNALGSPLIGDGPHFWAAPWEQGEEYGGLGWPRSVPKDLHEPRTKRGRVSATTIGAIITDASLNKMQANRVAIMAHAGLARAIVPSHAPMDGDTVFCAATGCGPAVEPADLLRLGHAAAIAFARAVARGVFRAAPGSAQVPAWGERFG